MRAWFGRVFSNPTIYWGEIDVAVPVFARKLRKHLSVARPRAQKVAKENFLLSNPAGKKPDPEIAKRRAIVKANRSMPTAQICKRLDLDHVPPPQSWEDFRGWAESLRSKKYGRQIRTMISKDKKAAGSRS